jgi:hypothetical protein
MGLWVRIPPVTWMSVCCKCWVLSGRDIFIGLITRPEESYRVWCVWVWLRSLDNKDVLAHWGLLRHSKKRNLLSNLLLIGHLPQVLNSYHLRTVHVYTCVTNPSESLCIRTSERCWCRWVRTFSGPLRLLLPAHPNPGGPVCWRFQDGWASTRTRLRPLFTRNAHARGVPRCFGGTSRPGPRIHVSLRTEFLFGARNEGRPSQICFWYVLPITGVPADAVDNEILWISTRKFNNSHVGKYEGTNFCNVTPCSLARNYPNYCLLGYETS